MKSSHYFYCFILIFFLSNSFLDVYGQTEQPEVSTNFSLQEYQLMNMKELVSLVDEYHFNFKTQAGNVLFFLWIKQGDFDAAFPSSVAGARLHEVIYNEEKAIITVYSQGMYSEEINGFIVRSWTVPSAYRVEIKKDWFIDYLVHKGENKKDIIMSYSNEIGVCQGVVITDNLRVRSQPSVNKNSEILKKLMKFQEIQIINSTSKPEEIDGILRPWYKIKLEDGSTGWVFGGYVIIYNTEEEKQIAKQAFALNSTPIRRVIGEE